MGAACFFSYVGNEIAESRITSRQATKTQRYPNGVRMTYIVAFVKFDDSSTDYAVDCLRTDLKVDDLVLVSLQDRKSKPGVITALQYLNWDCKGRILCKLEELIADEHGVLILREGTVDVVGLATISSTMKHLISLGWIVQKPVSKAYRAALTASNSTSSANIFFRKNGVDLQLLPYKHSPAPVPNSPIHINRSSGRFISHFLSQSGFNLYEGIDRFSRSFLSDENNYERFFSKSVGSPKLLSPADIGRHQLSSDSTEHLMSLEYALRDCKDADGQIYLGDGVYL